MIRVFAVSMRSVSLSSFISFVYDLILKKKYYNRNTMGIPHAHVCVCGRACGRVCVWGI